MVRLSESEKDMKKDDFIWAISMIAAILIAYTLIEITVALGVIKTFVFVMSVFWLNTFIRLNEHEIERKKRKYGYRAAHSRRK